VRVTKKYEGGDFFSFLPCVAVPIYWCQLWENSMYADYVDKLPAAMTTDALRALRGGDVEHKAYVRTSLLDVSVNKHEVCSLMLERTHWLHCIRRASKSAANLQLQVTWIKHEPYVWLKVCKPIEIGDELRMHWTIPNEKATVKVFLWLAI
jgi:hypothetical protein